jgi:hypothetical protein
MKKLLMNFATNLLSKQQMKEIKGGGSYRCYCPDINAYLPGCTEAETKFTVWCPCFDYRVDNCY